jgi:TMEM175 potassium channel family protein
MTPSEKARVEAFSDGVFAIAITLLILEIRLPHETYSSAQALTGSLGSLWPSFLAYVASFATILVTWINHHGLFHMIHRVNRPLLFANGFLLLVVTFIPFPTAVIAAHLTGDGASAAAVLYCGTFILLSISFLILFYTATPRRSETAAKQRHIERAYWAGFTVYTLSTLVAWFYPLVGTAICSLLWLQWIWLDYGNAE